MLPLVSDCSLSSPPCGRILFSVTAPSGLCFVCCIVFFVLHICSGTSVVWMHQVKVSLQTSAATPVSGDIPSHRSVLLNDSVCVCVCDRAWVCLRLTGRSPGGQADCHTPIKWKTNCMHRGRMCTLCHIGSLQNLCPLWNKKKTVANSFCSKQSTKIQSHVESAESDLPLYSRQVNADYCFCITQQEAARLPSCTVICVHSSGAWILSFLLSRDSRLAFYYVKGAKEVIFRLF